jgi:hypothetical protein
MFDADPTTGYQTLPQSASIHADPATNVTPSRPPTKLPPLNLYWSENKMARTQDQSQLNSAGMEQTLHDDVFDAVYTDLAPSIDSTFGVTSGGDRLFKEENYDFFMDDISSPLQSDGNHFPGFYSFNLPNFEAITSPTCTESSRSLSPSDTNSPFLTSPSQYQSFHFPPLNDNHVNETDWINDLPVDDLPSPAQPLACRWVDCKGTFDNQEDLVQHIERNHVDQRRAEDFTCFWAGCPRRHRPFNARYKLLIHMRVHSGEKPNRCSVSC